MIMTVEEMKQSDKRILTPEEVAQVCECDPAKIRETAKVNPQLLGFPVSVIGTRVKIWRIPFLKYIGEYE